MLPKRTIFRLRSLSVLDVTTPSFPFFTEPTLSLNEEMMVQNIYYQDLMDGKILQPLQVRRLPQGAFNVYMQSIGKLGGQNKVPRLCNDRSLADVMETYLDLRPLPT